MIYDDFIYYIVLQNSIGHNLQRNKAKNLKTYMPFNYRDPRTINNPEFERSIKAKEIVSSETRYVYNEIKARAIYDSKTRKDKLESMIIKSGKDYRRKGFLDKCSKEAKKICKEACFDVHKTFCRLFGCSLRAKIRFKKECRYSCKIKFKTSEY